MGKNEQLSKAIIKDIKRTRQELLQRKLIRDYREVSEKHNGPDYCEISFSGKSSANSIMFDKYIAADSLIRTLLNELQYTVLMYDKGIIQAEFQVVNDKIEKERMVFLRKHNSVKSMEEIEYADIEDVDWFSEDNGFPVCLRFDFDPASHVECIHPIAHLTLSNNETCRIPANGAISFSEFVGFVLRHFYGINLEMDTYKIDIANTITEIERKMIHMGWEY